MKKLILLICVFSLLFNCSSDDSNSDGNTSFDPDDYQYFIKGKLNGEDFLYGLRTDATSIEYTSFSGFSGSCNPDNEDFMGINFSSGIEPVSDASLPSMSFSFIRFYLCSNPETSHDVFNDLFPITNYSLATDFETISGTTGAVGIFYLPPNSTPGSDYYSSFVDGVTPNGNFVITSSEASNQFFVSQKIEGDFSITLYNINDSSDVIELTEGSFKMNVTNHL